MPISCYTTRNRRKKRAGVSPLDPTAERILEMRSGNIAIKTETHLCQKSDRGAVVRGAMICHDIIGFHVDFLKNNGAVLRQPHFYLN